MSNTKTDPSISTPSADTLACNASPSPVRLALRRVLIDTYHENVAYMHRDCEVYRAEGFKALSKVEIRTDGHTILATLNVVEGEGIVSCGELGLSKDAFAQMGVEDGQTATVI